MTLEPILAFYALPLVALWSLYALKRRRAEARALATRNEATEAGLSEPSSLHPSIDSSMCVGCKACINACPEGNILGLINNKAELIEPANCIGHGACKTACPVGAITLVYGTATRGVDLPVVHPDFESNVPGIFIAGELGGMGLIRNAVEQGRQAIATIASRPRSQHQNMLDVVIVGSGPAGLSASLAAIENQLRFVTLEQETMGGTIAHFPRGKLVMTTPAILPLVGPMPFREVSKEVLMEFWHGVARKTRLRINAHERVETIEAVEGGFVVKSTRATYPCRSVLLTIGRRGTPRKLGVPGEDLSKVTYRLVDSAQYRGQHVLVVGGGDSALEAAASLAEEPGTQVILSYRNAAFARAKTKNRNRVAEAQSNGRLNVLLGTKLTQIGPRSVAIQVGNAQAVYRNDSVIVCAGGILPTDFLRSIGINIETKYGTA